MPRLSNAERNQAVGMLQAGQSKRQVARQFHCSPSTVSRLWQRYLETDLIGRAPDGKKLRLQSKTSISWPSISATDSVLLHKLPQRLQGYASHGSAPVRSATGSTRSTWALAHLRLSTSDTTWQQNRLNWARIHKNWTLIQWRGVLFWRIEVVCTLDRRESVATTWREVCRLLHTSAQPMGRRGCDGVGSHLVRSQVAPGGHRREYDCDTLHRSSTRPTLLPLLAQHRDFSPSNRIMLVPTLPGSPWHF